LLNSTDELVSIWPRSRAVCTGRDDMAPVGFRVVKMPPLGQQQALDLICTLAGTSQGIGYDWSKELRETVCWPLFTLLTAGRLARGESVAGRAELIHALVTEALHVRGAAELGLSEERLYELLVRAAVLTTGARRPIAMADVGNANEQQVLRDTRLVEVAGGSIVFPIPIVEQWLAAQALLQGEVSTKELASDVGLFARWRYPAAVAVSVGPAAFVEQFMTTLTEGNVGAASWVVQHGIPDDSHQNKSEETLDADDAGHRIRDCMTAWTRGIGHLALRISPALPDGSLPPLGVTTMGQHVTAAWAWPDEDLPPVGRITPPISLDERDSPWNGFRSSHVATHEGWAWLWTLQELQAETGHLLEGGRLSTNADHGVLAREHAYFVARVVLGQAGSILHRPMPRTELDAAFSPLINSDGSAAYGWYQFGRRHLSARDIETAWAWFSHRDTDPVERPWPTPDQTDLPGRGWIWDVYSLRRMAELWAAVLDSALTAYEELATGLFSSFGAALGLGVAGPVRVEARIGQRSGARDMESEPDIDYVVLPQDAALSIAVSEALCRGRSRVEIVDGPPGMLWDREFMEKYWLVQRQLKALRPASEFLSLPSGGGGGVSIYFSRPATSLAVRWLADDLRRLGWVKNRPRWDGGD
jgi:hypothetical protein